jgi:hypothetical protein
LGRFAVLYLPSTGERYITSVQPLEADERITNYPAAAKRR